MSEPRARTILIVEDDDDLRELVALMLEDFGYETMRAPNGAEALSSVKSAMPDLILLDMRMPVMSGWAFVAAYRAQYGRAAPIVVMTAAEHAAKHAFDVGAEGWLSKPFGHEELIEMIEAQLAQANSLRPAGA